MATLAELLERLKRADAAGDTDAARAIVRAMKEQERLEGGGAALSGIEPGLEDRGGADAAWQGLTQGLSFGFGDEMSAGIRASLGGFAGDTLGSFGERYGEALEGQREKVSAAREHHPWITGGAELASGLAYGGAGALRGLATAGVRGAARAGAGRAGQAAGMTLQGNKARLAGMGAAYGGVAGAGYSDADSAAGRLGGAAMGGAMGAGLGVAIPAAGSAAVRGVQNLGRRFGLGKESGRIQRAAQEAARREIMRDLKRDGLTVREAEMLIAQNKNLMLGDLGKNLMEQGESVMAQPGAGGAKLKNILESRSEKTFDRAMPMLRRGAEESLLTSEGMAVPSNYAEAERAIINRARTLTKGLWEDAYSPNFRPTPWMQRKLARVPMKDGTQGRIVDPRWRRADREATEAIDIRIANFTRDGNKFDGIPANHPGRVAMHYDEMQRSLRDRISEGKRGVVSMGDRRAKILKDEHAKFIDEMERTMAPEWKAARKLWAGEARNKEAMEAGEKIFSSYADDILIRLDEMTMSERDSYVVGALRSIEKRLGLQNETGDILRQLRQTRVGKDVIRIIFGGEKGFQRFMSFARDELKMLDFYKKAQGSPTFGRISKHADTGGAVGTLAGMWVGMNLGIAGVPLLGRYAGRKATIAMNRADEAKRDAMAKMLRTRMPGALNMQMQRPLLPLSPMLGTLGLGAAQAMPGLLE